MTTQQNLTDRARNLFINFPVAINTNYGDPFQYTQYSNTLQKLRYLRDQNHQGEVMLGTKYVLSDKQIDEVHSINPNVWFFYSLNGSNETPKYSMAQRSESYLRLCSTFDRTVLSLRPIIPGRNDRMEVLQPLLDLCKEGRGILHHGGYRDPHVYSNMKYDYPELRPILKAAAAETGIQIYPKCTCIVRELTGRTCVSHTTSHPKNLDILEAVGFRYELEDGYVSLKSYQDHKVLKKADVSFARHVIQSSKIISNWNDFHEETSMRGPNGQTLICTSSWFGWSRQSRHCELNCDYCFVKPGLPIHYEAGDAGCSPLDLYNYLFEG